jgi:putative ABC transport system permease protein
MELVKQISLVDLMLAGSFIVVLMGLTFLERLQVAKDFFIGAARAFAQLYIVGGILVYIFTTRHPGLIMLVLLVMLAVATHTAVSRQTVRIRNIYPIIWFSLIIASGITMFMVTEVIVRWKPWYRPEYLIPIAGMIIGNAMNAAALAAERLSADIRGNRQLIEAKLALGASSFQAARTFVIRSIRASLIPSINSMMVVGIVQLPGMMTGLIIAHQSPVMAVRYQLVIVYAIAFSVGVTSMLVVYQSYRQFFTRSHQLIEDL